MNVGVRNPDWSLGSYVSTRVVREKEDDPTAKIIEIIDTFSGGQHCDENNQKRSTEVHIQVFHSLIRLLTHRLIYLFSVAMNL